MTTLAGSAPGAADALRPRLAGLRLDARHVAEEPPEARGLSRDGVRLMVSAGTQLPEHSRFRDLGRFLRPGDLLVVNNSATIPAAVDATLDDGRAIVVHLSTRLPGGLWSVEPRRPLPGGSTAPLALDGTPGTATLTGGHRLRLLAPLAGSQRLWMATLDDEAALLAELVGTGRPIRYPYVPRDWPLDAYQSVFATAPGSAEMASAARPFTPELVTHLIGLGVGLAPITLHTGVSSLEGHELPYPERFEVPQSTATAVNATRDAGGRVVAVGTTVVRALESAVDDAGRVHPAGGWTELVVTPARGVEAVDGLLTGWHEPAATHLAMLEAVAGIETLELAYRRALADGYLWHEFGDSHLLLPGPGR